jgi:multiple sugar transport system permease protein
MNQPTKAKLPTSGRSLPLSFFGRKTNWWLIAGYLALIVFVFWTIIPIYWMVLTSFKSGVSLYNFDEALWPRTFVLDGYRDTLVKSPFPTFFMNSFIVAVSTTIVSAILGSLAAYAITRLHFLGRNVSARVLVAAYLAPSSMLFIPMYALMSWLKLTNTLWGLALAYLTFTIPFCTWMLIGYFKSIPVELEEAALVDGANRFTALWRIIVPLSAPAMVVVAIFAFTLSWNEFTYALVLVQRKDVVTAPIGLTFFQVGDMLNWVAIMAAATMMSIPPVLLYLVGQRWVVSGWTMGAVKG